MKASDATERRHWAKIALWLAGISLIPAGVTLYTALTDGSHAGQPALAAVAVVAVVATLTTFGAAAKAIGAAEAAKARQHARVATTAFMATAMAMCAAYLVIITIDLLQAFT